MHLVSPFAPALHPMIWCRPNIPRAVDAELIVPCVLSGTKLPAKFTATMFDVRDRNITTDEAIDNETLPQIFSLGQPKNSSEMRYSYKFSKVLPLAVDAYNAAVGRSLDCGSISDNLGILK